MIQLLFYYGSEVVLVDIRGHQITFGNSVYGAKMADISGINLDMQGVIKEHPDLEGDLDWKEKAIERFKEKIKELNDEDKIADYIINDLKQHGYLPKFKQKAGHRRVPI